MKMENESWKKEMEEIEEETERKREETERKREETERKREETERRKEKRNEKMWMRMIWRKKKIPSEISTIIRKEHLLNIASCFYPLLLLPSFLLLSLSFYFFLSLTLVSISLSLTSLCGPFIRVRKIGRERSDIIFLRVSKVSVNCYHLLDKKNEEPDKKNEEPDKKNEELDKR